MADFWMADFYQNDMYLIMLSQHIVLNKIRDLYIRNQKISHQKTVSALLDFYKIQCAFY